jgi:hypothetical protein
MGWLGRIYIAFPMMGIYRELLNFHLVKTWLAMFFKIVARDESPKTIAYKISMTLNKEAEYILNNWEKFIKTFRCL